MVRTLTAPFAFAARRAAGLLARAGRAEGVNETMFEALEERTVLAADLQATLTTPALTGLASAGGALSGSILLQNTGNAAATGFTYRVILSADSVVGNEDDVVFANSNQTATLAANAQQVVNLNIFNVPAGIRADQYFLIVTLDTTNVVEENSETNNRATSSTPFLTMNGAATGTANLTATVTFSNRTVNPDQQFTIPTLIRNTGAAASGAFHVTWVLSANNIIGDADDIAIDEEDITTIAAGGEVTINRVIDLPVGIALGSYRIGVWVDDLADVAESSEANNRIVTTNPVLTVALPDLSATFTTTGGAVAPGAFFTGNLTIRNNTAAQAGAFRIFICLSTDNVAGNGDDIILLTLDINDPGNEDVGLNGSTTRTINGLRVYVPFGTAGGTLNPGQYRVAVVVDGGEDVDESNEANNSSITANPIVTVPARNTANDPAGADLRSFVFPVSGTVQPGQTIDVGAILANTGNAAASGPVLALYLSTNNTWSEDDVLLGNFELPEGAFNGGSIYGVQRFEVPGGAPNGAVFVVARPDPSNTVEETDEENNNSAAAGGTVARSTVSITASDATAGEVTTGTANGASFRISRTGSTTTALTVQYSVSGTADEGDFNSGAFTGEVVIPAGQSFVLLNLSAVNDSEAEDDETVIVAIDADDFYTVSPTQEVATATILDNETRISITASDAAAAEVATGAANPGVFRVSRTGPTAEALTVTFVLAGTASDTDFSITGTGVTYDAETNTGTVLIPAGSAFATFTVNVVNDSLAEPAETVRATIDPTTDYSVSPAAQSATVTIADNEPVITVTASDAAAAEITANNAGGAFRLTRVGTTGALEVFFTISGTTALTGDYTLTAPAGTTLTYDPVTGEGSVIIPNGASFAQVNVNVIDDSLAESNETVVLTLASDETYNLPTNVAQRSGTVTIADNEPIVTIAVVDAAGAETFGTQVANGGQFRVTRPAGNTAADLVVNYTVSGTATSGSDFTALSGSVTIPANQTSALINLAVLNDALVESAETVIVTLSADDAYRLSPTASQRLATATIADNEPVVSIRAIDAIGAEVVTGGTENFGLLRLTRTGDLTQQLSVNVLVSGTADDQDWVNFINTELVFGAGDATSDFPIVIIDDAVWEASETIVVTLQTGDGYTLTSTVVQRSATVTITDNENTVSITARDRAAAEVTTGAANPGTFRVARTGGVNTLARTVFFTITGTADRANDFTLSSATAGANVTLDTVTGIGSVTIPAGAAFVDFTLNVVNDTTGELAETAVVTLNSNAAYRLALSAAQRTATVNIADNEAVVSITASDSAAGEVTSGTANGGAWRVSRTGTPTTAALTVNFTITGTAGLTGDYALTSPTAGANLTFDDTTGVGTVTIPAGATFVLINLGVTDDLIVEAQETAIATLNSGTGYRVTSTVLQQSATVKINDNEPRFGVIANDAAGSEPSGVTANTINFRISRTLGGAGQVTVVRFSMGGGAALSGDYLLTSSTPGASLTYDDVTGIGTVTFTATTSVVNILLTPLTDANAEESETAVITLLSAANNTQGYSLVTNQTSATGTIANVAPIP